MSSIKRFLSETTKYFLEKSVSRLTQKHESAFCQSSNWELLERFEALLQKICRWVAAVSNGGGAAARAETARTLFEFAFGAAMGRFAALFAAREQQLLRTALWFHALAFADGRSALKEKVYRALSRLLAKFPSVESDRRAVDVFLREKVFAFLGQRFSSKEQIVPLLRLLSAAGLSLCVQFWETRTAETFQFPIAKATLARCNRPPRESGLARKGETPTPKRLFVQNNLAVRALKGRGARGTAKVSASNVSDSIVSDSELLIEDVDGRALCGISSRLNVTLSDRTVARFPAQKRNRAKESTRRSNKATERSESGSRCSSYTDAKMMFRQEMEALFEEQLKVTNAKRRRLERLSFSL